LHRKVFVAVIEVFGIGAGLWPVTLPLGRIGEFLCHAPEFPFLLRAFLDEGEEEFGAAHVAFEGAIDQRGRQLFAFVADVARCCLGKPGDSVAPDAFFWF